MENINTKLSEQFRKLEDLERKIRENLAGLGYEL
jgi:type I restriction enzyme M protein